MSWPDFRKVLSDLFSEINSNNNVPSISDIDKKLGKELAKLRGVSAEIDRQIVTLSASPEIASPKPAEVARLLFLLKQRRQVSSNGRPLVGRIRGEIVPRERPPFNLPLSGLTGEVSEIGKIGRKNQYSQFQVEGWKRVLDAIRDQTGLVVLAPTGAGKSEVFMLPLLYQISQHISGGNNPDTDPRYIFLYPRVELLKDQLERIFRYVYWAEKQFLSSPLSARGSSRRKNSIIIGFQFSGVGSKSKDTLEDLRIFESGRLKFIDKCPICGVGVLEAQNKNYQITPLKCSNPSCDAIFSTTISKEDHVSVKPHILVTTDESLNRFYLTPRPEYTSYLASISGVIFDEAHLWYSLKGAHLFNLISNIEALNGSNSRISRIAASATISNPESFAAKLFYGDSSKPVAVHDAASYEKEYDGLEVLYFLQSPPQDNLQPTSTMIQTAMAVGHGVFSDRPFQNMERAILFTESVDIANRFQAQIQDAESQTQLWAFRTSLADIYFDGNRCPNTDPAGCSTLYQTGECWRGIIGENNCVSSSELRENPMSINCISSKNPGSYLTGEIVVATSSLEVGVDDNRIKTTLHYRPPRDVFSFIQRRGRAGRSRGDVAYSIMVLGNEPSDQFYLYRRNRLLSLSSYELPFNPQNSVVAEMHKILSAARSSMVRFARLAGGTQRGTLDWFFNKLESCSVIRSKYSGEIGRIKTIPTAEGQQRELIRWFEREQDRYERYLNVVWTLDEIENYIPIKLKKELDEIRKLVNRFLGGDTSVEAALQKKMPELASQIQILIFAETDPDVQESLSVLPGKLLQVWGALRTSASTGFSPSISRGFFDFFRTLSEKINKHWLFNYEPDVIRSTLQAFFYLGLETLRDSSHRTCRSCQQFFVPDTFFQQVKPLIIELRSRFSRPEPRIEQESVTDLATQFFPYKTFYRYFGTRELSLIETVTKEVRSTSMGTEVTVELRGDGIHTPDGKFVPQKVFVRPIFSDNEANGFVKLCESCYSVHGLGFKTCCGQNLTPVKLYAQQIIERKAINDSTTPPEPFSRTLEFLELIGDTSVIGADVDANRLRWDPGKGAYGFSKAPKIEFFARYDKPVAYQIPTRGIRWRLASIVGELLENTELKSALGLKLLNPDLILHTAVHMLFKAISSISGVSQDILEYAIDVEGAYVTVWERYDGGAGISETLRESVRTDPSTFYKELLASVVCPIHLDEDSSWSDPKKLISVLSRKWLLPEDDEFLEILVSEAVAERRAGLQSERIADAQISCQDGCPVCIQVTTCTMGKQQLNTTSRNVAEAILLSLLRSVDKPELRTLMGESLSQNIINPLILKTDPTTRESDVLLL